MARHSTLLPLLLELQTLDRLPRTGYLMRGVSDAESVSEHCFHVAVLVLALAGSVDGLDRERTLELALLHDLGELRISDLPRTANRYLPEGAKRRAELAAGRDLLAPLGDRARALHREALEGESREARFVHACDQLQMLIKVAAYERAGARGLEEFWDSTDLAACEFDSVRAVFETLTAERLDRG